MNSLADRPQKIEFNTDKGFGVLRDDSGLLVGQVAAQSVQVVDEYVD